MSVPVIVLTNQKGGVGKTTTADAIADGLRRRGKRVLAIDTDPQGSLGMLEERFIADGSCCCSNFFKGYDVVPDGDGQATVPGDVDLSFVQGMRDCQDEPLDELSLRHAIDAAVERHGFDAVVVDTQPGMTFLTISSLLAATHIIIPTTADRLGVEAIAQDISFFDSLSTSFDVRWESEPAVLITLFRGMASLSRAFAEQIETMLPEQGLKVFFRRIPQNIMIQEAQQLRESIYDQRFQTGRIGAKVMRGAAAEYDLVTTAVCKWVWGLDEREEI